MSTQLFTVEVPGSSANLGPGFDSLSIALHLHLLVHVSLSPSPDTFIEIQYEGGNKDSISVDVEKNLLGVAMMHVVRKMNGVLPVGHILLDVRNEITLSKGLGSSGATIIAGCMIASELCGLKLDRKGILKAALDIESHPDNISASVAGGFVVSCVDPSTGDPSFIATKISSQMKAVVVIPNIEKSGGTHSTRKVLPDTYSKADAVFNIQHSSLLTALMSKPNISEDDAILFASAMQDRIHQPYRQVLVPGLEEILKLNSSKLPGLLGVCMSGAGPSVLALTTGNVENNLNIGKTIRGCFLEKGIEAEIKILEIDNNGATVHCQ